LKILIIIISFISIINISNAQDIVNSDKGNIEFLPASNLFEPVKASVIEARNGVIKDVGKNNLLLNIGISADILKWQIKKQYISLGADFFTYSNLRTESNFKFPVDAIDYFFGFNFNYKRNISSNYFIGRLRISHISAHLEDGHKYIGNDTIFIPFVYSREFLDLSAGYDYYLSKGFNIKNVISINILFHSIPDDFGLISLQYGFEFKYFINSFLSVYFSNDIKYQTVRSENYFNENLESGIRLGKQNSKGFSISFNYYNGKDYKGQYFNDFLNYKAIGFNVDL